MSKWAKVGEWVKGNAGAGASLVGSLVTGNLPGALAAGISMISGATGTDDPDKALAELQGNPDAIVKLKQIYMENEKSTREHLEAMNKAELEDKQAEHHETQNTIRNGDNSQYAFVRFTRPAQSWTSLAAGIIYIFYKDAPSLDIAILLFTLPLAYAGLRQVGKGISSLTGKLNNKFTV